MWTGYGPDTAGRRWWPVTYQSVRTRPSAVFAFFCTKLDEIAEELDAIDRPLRLCFGDQDSHLPVDIAQSLKARLASKPTAEVHIHPGAGRGFFNPVRKRSTTTPGASKDGPPHGAPGRPVS